jgi:hypothetical protein
VPSPKLTRIDLYQRGLHRVLNAESPLPAAVVRRSLAKQAARLRSLFAVFSVLRRLGSAGASYSAGFWIDQVSAAASRAGNSLVYFALNLRRMVGGDCLHVVSGCGAAI